MVSHNGKLARRSRRTSVLVWLGWLVLVGCKGTGAAGSATPGAAAAATAADGSSAAATGSAQPIQWGEALRIAQALAEETGQLQEPGALPLPMSDSEGKDTVLALEGLVDGTPPPPRKQERSLTIGLTTNWMGEVDPCGCLKNPLGGLARLATYWERIREARTHTLLLDAGGTLLSGPLAKAERPGEVGPRTALYAQVFKFLGYRAMNVGVADLALGLPQLRAFERKAGLTLLSANLVDYKSGKSVFAPLLVEQHGVVKVAIIGLISPSPPEYGKAVLDQGLRIISPIDAAKAQVAAARAAGAHVLIVLSQLRHLERDQLLQAVPEIDLVLGSSDSDLTIQPQILGKDTFFVDALHKGKYLAVTTLEFGAIPHVLHAAKLPEVLREQQRVVAAQLLTARANLTAATQPAAGATGQPGSAPELEREVARLQAQLQRLTLQMEAGATAPAGASTLDLHLQPMGDTLPDHPKVGAWMAEHHKRFPAPQARSAAEEADPMADFP